MQEDLREAYFIVESKIGRSAGSEWEELLKFGKTLERYIRGRGYNSFMKYSLSEHGSHAILKTNECLSGIGGFNYSNPEGSLTAFANELCDIFPTYNIRFDKIVG